MKFVLIILLLKFLSAQELEITTDSNEARRYYERAWASEKKMNLENAEFNYKEAIKLDSTFSLAYLRLAMLRDNFDTRRFYLKKAMKYSNRLSESEKLLIRGRNAFYGNAKEEEEFKSFKRLYELNPLNAEANYLYGYVHIHHGKSEPNVAIKLFRKAIDIDSEFLKAYNDLIYAYMDVQNYKEAKVIAEKFIEKLPDAIEPLDSYADLLMRSGHYEA